MNVQRIVRLVPALLIAAQCLGCQDEPQGVPHAHHEELEATLCGICGEEKDTEKCCVEGAAMCRECGKQKDSVLCCSAAIHGVRDIILCRKCGEVGFTEDCCRGSAERCGDCGLIDGSPGCCQIEPYDPNQPHE
ncbi:MAG: hypothetical protein AAF961_15025 [Planctomycetota bacterium]